MDTTINDPMTVFHLPGHFVVPLFQRSYVWEEEEQWAPLWQDVRRIAELVLDNPLAQAHHFLGAIVLQSQDGPVGRLPVRNLIDGQQRLTTLQLLLDATGAVLEEQGLEALSAQLHELTHNRYVDPGESALKLRHTNSDGEAFAEVMDAEPPVAHDQLRHSGSLITKGHAYFCRAVSEWLVGDKIAVARRADALTTALMSGLQLVVIQLQAAEDSQAIFETLNARGTPLTSADLIKNFVFQRLAAEGADTARAYAEQWPFESGFWTKEVSVGRVLMNRSSVFFNQWLASRTGEDLSPRSTFSRFKTFAEHDTELTMTTLLPIITEQAARYEAWTSAAADPDRSLDIVSLSVYRMNAAGIELLKPVLLWLHEPEAPRAADIVAAVVRTLESWVFRRQLLRLPSSDLGRIVADVIRRHRRSPDDQIVDAVRDQLASLDTVSTYWPGDAEIRARLSDEAAYRRYSRARLRMYLEAIENQHRGRHDQPQVKRNTYPIEHILPQSWRTSWGVAPEDEARRAEHVHRLGNLTLLTRSLNSSVSNGPWTDKRKALHEHDTFLINREFRRDSTLDWEEHTIDARTQRMVDALLTEWPVPAGHTGQIADSTNNAASSIDLRDLVAADLLPSGTVLHPREGRWADRTAEVTLEGRLRLDGQVFDTPSGAAKHVKGGASNGWYFWRLDDGVRLADMRAALSNRAARPGSVGWDPLHAMLERLSPGRWTSYQELGDVLGTSAPAVGRHLGVCRQCVGMHRVLTAEGRISPDFRWPDAYETRDPATVLASEGLAITNGRADPARFVSADDLAAPAA